jgi:exoribonuclease II
MLRETRFIRKNLPFFGVLLREVPGEEGRNVIQTLMADGRIVTHLAYDILYVVPNLIDTFHINRCGVEDKPVNTKELMARVSVAEKVRGFCKTVEDLYNGYAAQFNSVYPRVCAADGEAWAFVTLAEAAKLLDVQHPDRRLVLHAVYSRLMKHSQMFVMDSHNFLSSQTFCVRPRAHVERFNKVWHLMHTGSPRVKQFTVRAKEIISELRRMSKGSKNRSPSYRPVVDMGFTEDDQLFIRFFLDSLVNMRSVQTNPYTPLICDIIKTLGLYDGDIDLEQVHQFLVDIGVLAPWQDIATLREVQPALNTAVSDPIPRVRAKSVLKSALTTSVLGPDDLYPSDPLESIRHDFGRLPVYTIDDYGAQELDDGISIERDTTDPSSLWVHIHVADPTAILPPTHSLARRARDAVQSHYFYHGSKPMLPKPFASGKLSLGNTATNGEAENVMTFSAKVDSNGDIIDYKVRAGIVRNVHTLKYDEVDATMSFHPSNATFPFGRPTWSSPTPLNLSPADRENLHLLGLFSKRMVARRLDSSTFSYGLGHPELRVSPKTLPVGMVDSMQPGLFLGEPEISYAVLNPVSSGSRQIVAEAAQVANRVASRFGLDRGVPLARRSLLAPMGSDEVLADLLRLRDKDGWVDFFEVRRKAIQFPLGRYTLEPAEHWTLGVAKNEGYTRATSPLRRYGDLFTHWQIKHVLLHNKPLFSSKEMQTTFEYIGGREQRWKWVEHSHKRWWALNYIKQWTKSDGKNNAHNPVGTMIGRVTARARQDIVRGTWAQEVYIANLGLFGILEGAEAELEIGAEVAMTIDKIVLSTHPVLRLKSVGQPRT